MYLALGWLIGLCFAMWVAICCVDLLDCNEQTKHNIYKGFSVNLFKSQNISSIIIRQGNANRRNSIDRNEQETTALLRYAMFFAGALAVSIFNIKKEILLFTRTKIVHINLYAKKFIKHNMKLKRTAFNVTTIIIEFISIFGEYCKNSIKKYISKRKTLPNHLGIHFELLKKIKEYGEERKNLGQLLIYVIRENKNIRMLYQMEANAKSRLLRNIEDTQKQIKENRSKYVNYQNLYLVTHQENIFLKARLKKVCKEKEQASANLIGLVNEVYHSRNSELKAYCSRYIVQTRQNLLNSDVSVEIEKFLRRTSRDSLSRRDSFNYFNLESDSRMTEGLPDERRLLLISDAPKLKGLPGECIWTVKGKDGLIEKIYEYDYEADVEKGDIIRRIRKYSVCHATDCLLDVENSKRLLSALSSSTVTLQQEQYVRVENPLTTNHRFLTGSEAFQRFLQDNRNFPAVSIRNPPVLLEE